MLVPGTLPSGTNFPGTPQAFLNLFATYLSAPPSKKTVFSQPTSSGVPTDGSALWWNTTNNYLAAYYSGAWNPALVGDASGNLTLSGTLTAAALGGGAATNMITTAIIFG